MHRGAKDARLQCALEDAFDTGIPLHSACSENEPNVDHIASVSHCKAVRPFVFLDFAQTAGVKGFLQLSGGVKSAHDASCSAKI